MNETIQELLSKYRSQIENQDITHNELKQAIQELQEFIDNVIDDIPKRELRPIYELQDELRNKAEKVNDQSKPIDIKNNNSSNIPSAETDEFQGHDSQAMHFIELADEAFFIGAWGKAIDLYEQVLKIEENWARAKEYLEKSKENFNNHVSPPTLSIPAQLRTLVTQAESAITHWNLDNAESYITRAYAEVKNLGMRSWENLDTVSERI